MKVTFEKVHFIQVYRDCNNLTDIILALLSMNHPYATLANIFTFMWCIWKSRNDMLFQRKCGQPHQIFLNAQALANNLELCNSIPSYEQGSKQAKFKAENSRMATPTQGSMITIDRLLQGVIIYTDASCRNNKDAIQGQSVGLGIYIRDDAAQKNWRIKIQAISQQEATIFQAEAKALSLAAQIAKIL